MNDSIIAKGYNILKWGILISALHINIMVGVSKDLSIGLQIVPAFIGFIIIAYSIRMMNKNGGERYFKGLAKSSIYLVILSIIQFVIGLVFGYGTMEGYADMGRYAGLLSQGFILASFLYELLLYSDILNMTVRLYKDNFDYKAADLLRQKRITVIKLGLVLAVVYAVSMVPNLTDIMNYSCITLTLMLKIWITMFIQNVAKKPLSFKTDEEMKKLNDREPMSVDNIGSDSL